MGIRQTRYLKIDRDNIDGNFIGAAAKVLRNGGLVAFPTETVYGLGANAFDANAVAKIFVAKGRPADNPLIVHLAGGEDVSALIKGKLPSNAKKLIENFWPGPLTLVLPKGEKVPLAVTAGLNTVALRMPAHPVALALIQKAGVPIAAPSANLSGRPSPTTAQHVLADLDGRLDVILDGGPANVGLESTVLDMTAETPVVLRPGGVTVEELRSLLGRVDVDPGLGVGGANGGGRTGMGGGAGMGGTEGEFTGDHMGEGRPRSPGLKYKHYAPRARVVLVEGEHDEAVRRIRALAQDSINKGHKTGILAPAESTGFYRDLAAHLLTLGSLARPAEAAAALFSCLRELDDLRVEVIYVEGVAPEGVGLAVMDRLRRAAAGNIIN